MYVIVTNKNRHQLYYGGFKEPNNVKWVPDLLSAISFTAYTQAEQCVKTKLRSRVDVVIIKVDSNGNL